MRSTLQRIAERKLVQWGLAYTAGAWLLLQVLDVVGSNFQWPRALFQSATVVLGIGLLAALVLAWYHGEKGEQRVSGVELLMLAALLLLAGVGLAWVGRSADAEASAGGALPPAGGGALVPTLAADVEADRRSIAVLPFASLSESSENEWFTDGIHDEILTTLANLGGLRVISRTSVMRYRDTEKSIPQIAAELGVAHVLEGSVQRAGGRVRINAQLIDARHDVHLWAERYDRPLEDIFAVQSEIAQRIAQGLQARLSRTEEERLERPRTANLTAFDYVLRARDFVRRFTPQHSDPGLDLARKARELDPTYADAYVVLSDAFLNRYLFRGDRPWLDSARIAAERATELDPSSGPGYSSLGLAHEWLGNREASLEAHRHAVAVNPNASYGLANLYHYSFGRLDEAARWWGPALEGDPTSSFVSWLAGRTYLHLGMTERARSLVGKAIEFDPESAWPYYSLSTAFRLEGKQEEAEAQIQRMLDATGRDGEALLFAGQSALARGDLERARRYFEQGLPGAGAIYKNLGSLGLAWTLQQTGEADRARQIVGDVARELEHQWGGRPRRPEDHAALAEVRVLQGDRAGALRAFEAAVAQGWRFHNDGLNEPILGSLRGDPRYDRLMREVRSDLARQRARVEREGW